MLTISKLFLYLLLLMFFIGCVDVVSHTDENGVAYILPESISPTTTKLLADLPAYTNEITSLVSFKLPFDKKKLEHLSVVVMQDAEPQWAGLYWYCCQIYIQEHPHMLAAYGHELIRYMAYMSGNPNGVEWNQSSEDWHNPIGELWDIAETTAIKYDQYNQ